MIPDIVYNTGCAILKAAKDFCGVILHNAKNSASQATTAGLKVKGARAVMEGVGMEIDLHVVVATNPIKLSQHLLVSQKDTSLFLVNFCFNFCYNFAVPRLVAEESVQKLKDTSSSALADVFLQGVSKAISSTVGKVVPTENSIVQWLSGYCRNFQQYLGNLVSNNLNAKCASKGAIMAIGLCAQSVVLSYFVNFEEEWNFKYFAAALLAVKATSFFSDIVQRGMDNIIFYGPTQSYIESKLNSSLLANENANRELLLKEELGKLGQELNSKEIARLTEAIMAGNFFHDVQLRPNNVQHEHKD